MSHECCVICLRCLDKLRLIDQQSCPSRLPRPIGSMTTEQHNTVATQWTSIYIWLNHQVLSLSNLLIANSCLLMPFLYNCTPAASHSSNLHSQTQKRQRTRLGMMWRRRAQPNPQHLYFNELMIHRKIDGLWWHVIINAYCYLKWRTAAFLIKILSPQPCRLAL